jgi:hypothetical protein
VAGGGAGAAARCSNIVGLLIAGSADPNAIFIAAMKKGGEREFATAGFPFVSDIGDGDCDARPGARPHGPRR